MMKQFRKMVAGILAAALCVASPTAAYGLEFSGDDFDTIVEGLDLSIPQRLAFTRPSESFTTTASAYYLTGNSDPNQTLYLNGAPVEGRGIYGSFGVYVGLQNGENHFVLAQGGEEVSVTITRGQTSASLPTTKVITAIYPSGDIAFNAGDTIKLTCNAPAGSSVTASVGGATVQMRQNVATAQKGIAATFTGEVYAGDLSGTQNIGQVTYTLNNDGAVSRYTSAGNIYVSGSDSKLTVEVLDTSATLFDRPSTGGNFVCTAKKGAIDTVEEIGANMYRLSMGGWVLKSSVQPVTQNVNTRTRMSDPSFVQTEKGEQFVIPSSSNPFFAAYQDSTRLHIKFFNTTGLGYLPIEDSTLFQDVSVVEENGDTVIELMLSPGEALWGYLVEYRDGNTIITGRYQPKLQGGSQPLSGMHIVLDPGHGGTDVGALGIARLTGSTEKEINYATAQAVKRRLESLGATVSLAREGDENPSLNQRLQHTKDTEADFFISLHCNSIAANTDGTKPNGVEVFYYEDISKGFASSLAANIASATGRTNRGGKYSNYKVTLNSFAPSVLVEMGFLTNPGDYDSLRSGRQIYNTANAIADSIVETLG